MLGDSTTLIGETTTSLVSLTQEERARHIALIGATGVGNPRSFSTSSPRTLPAAMGCYCSTSAVLVPRRRNNEVCYFNFADRTQAVGFNVLEDVDPDARALVVDGVVSAWRAIWPDMWGPRLEQILRHSAAALLEMPNASLVLMPRLLTDDSFRARVVARVSNPLTRNFFDRRFATWRDAFREEAIDPVL